MDTCSCLSCRAQRTVRRFAKRVALAAVVLTLTVGGLNYVGSRTIFLPEREVWFDRLLTLAVSADREFDKITEVAPQPENWREAWALVKEIIYQIEEEGASTQIIPPTDLSFADFGPGTRSAVAGFYSETSGAIVLNERYLYPGLWGSWLSTLVHELVHAQGYFVGASSTLEAQTEITATEVLAAMANLGYPGARAELLDGLRRDALKMAFYIAQFGGSPIHSSFDAPPVAGTADPVMLARLAAANAAVFTPTELARMDHRTRWWMESAAEYVGVLARYVVKTTTIEVDTACSESETVGENFQRFELYEWIGNKGESHWSWTKAPVQVVLHMDDLAYVLKSELHYC